MEEWKNVKGYEGYYQVSNTGLVKSLDREIILKDKLGNDRPSMYKGRILKQNMNTKGRLYVVLSKDCKPKTFEVHRLVAMAFVENIHCFETVNHIDGNCTNNNYENLEWVSIKENLRHAFKNNLIKTQKKVLQIDNNTGKIINRFNSESEACRYVNVSQGKVGRAIKRNGTCKGFKWKYE